MTIADILTFAGIVVSIVVGFFITHLNSVRDIRTRALKDYYIEQLKAIKGRVDKFYHQIAFGKSSFKKVVNWYEHIRLDITSIDKGIRQSLDLQIDEFGDILYNYYDEITGWEDFNNQYRNSHYHPTTECKEKLHRMKYEIDEFLNNYIQHVNQANNYPIWITQKNRINQSISYFRKKGCRYPILRAWRERIEKHIWESLCTIILICTVIWLCTKVEKGKKYDLETPLKEISYKQDTIVKSIREFKEKYEPIKIKAKTFNNSAFFNAQKVDSVQIKLYQKE